MPATFAHPAFAWPLRRLGLPWAALCVGSAVPDLAHLFPRRDWTDHTALSIVTFSLPMGVICYILFDRLVAPNLVAVAPEPWRPGLRAGRQPGAGAVRVALALLAGAAIHIGIDACTHVYGAPVQALPHVMQAPLVVGPFGTLLTYDVLQLLGTLGGTAFLVRRVQRWDHRHRAGPWRLRHLRGIAIAVVLAAGGATLSAWQESHWLPMPDRRQVFMVHGAMAGMVLLCFEALLVSVWLELRRAWRRRRF